MTYNNKLIVYLQVQWDYLKFLCLKLWNTLINNNSKLSDQIHNNQKDQIVKLKKKSNN